VMRWVSAPSAIRVRLPNASYSKLPTPPAALGAFQSIQGVVVEVAVLAGVKGIGDAEDVAEEIVLVAELGQPLVRERGDPLARIEGDVRLRAVGVLNLRELTTGVIGYRAYVGAALVGRPRASGR
jgi:hypothetical protein